MNDTIAGSTLTTSLRVIADWLDAHAGLPPVFSVSAYPDLTSEVSFSVDTDVEADALLALTDPEGRFDARYTVEVSPARSRIASGSIGRDVRLSVAVSR